MNRTLLGCMASLIINASAAAQPPPPAFVTQSFESAISLKLGYPYVVALPSGYEADAAKKWPLLVFLHGAGERGADLELMKVHGPLKLITQGQRNFEALVVCPQVPLGENWSPHGVKALVDKLKADYRVDAARVYLTGISMGGFGTWDTIIEYPGVFAAAVPICGGAGIGVLKFDRIGKLPIWIFHGAQDRIVPVEFSAWAYARLKPLGGPAQLTIYPGVDHDSWTQTYENPELWTWLFAQRLY